MSERRISQILICLHVNLLIFALIKSPKKWNTSAKLSFSFDFFINLFTLSRIINKYKYISRKLLCGFLFNISSVAFYTQNQYSLSYKLMVTWGSVIVIDTEIKIDKLGSNFGSVSNKALVWIQHCPITKYLNKNTLSLANHNDWQRIVQTTLS